MYCIIKDVCADRWISRVIALADAVEDIKSKNEAPQHNIAQCLVLTVSFGYVHAQN